MMKYIKKLLKKLLKIKDKKVVPKCSNCERWELWNVLKFLLLFY